MPLRKCTGCGELKESSQMIRIMKVHDTQEVLVNPGSSSFGRSSYLCYNKDCLQKALKKKRIPKTLKKEISEDIVEKIKTLTEN